ncbi:hypothetical protein [Desulfobulbus alkaliphilus]|uniref:hypothetical protein n=1 Tax=Desulfobulbus alkaliphilus TaxID=869814 RepID=UPI00196321FF|nr:hypothetical protein [Desulfobulbus alkaliphilus]MBM9538698.1 hypothetical protein [Desulfobulbus alkaliphilus]
MQILPHQTFPAAMMPAQRPAVIPLLTTLTIAGAVAVGSNMVDVQNRVMTVPQAVLNGLAKGAAATLILGVTTRSTPLRTALAAGVLAGAGYLIDSAMKARCQPASTSKVDR